MVLYTIKAIQKLKLQILILKNITML